MCYFITIAVSDSEADALKRVIPRALHLESVSNSFVSKQLPSGFRTFLLTTGGCSCGLYQKEIPPSADHSHLQRKYKRKGWSEAKIDRAIEQSITSRVVRSDFRGLRDDVLQILDDAARSVFRIGLFVHWNKGSVDEERVPLPTSRRLTVEELRVNIPQEGELLWIEA